MYIGIRPIAVLALLEFVQEGRYAIPVAPRWLEAVRIRLPITDWAAANEEGEITPV